MARLKLTLCLVLSSVFISFISAPQTIPQSVKSNCIECHSRAEGRAGEVVRIHLDGAHAKAGVDCLGCHGGDATQADKSKAHLINFTGKPNADSTLKMCGSCHSQSLAQFKTSRHFPERKGIPRLDCAECHGAHSVGNPPDSYDTNQFCGSCHGLEYLPALPQQFQNLLTLSDRLREGVKRIGASGRKPPQEIIDQRKEIRRWTGEIIHPTDRSGGIDKIPQILTQGEGLLKRIKTEGN